MLLYGIFLVGLGLGILERYAARIAAAVWLAGMGVLTVLAGTDPRLVTLSFFPSWWKQPLWMLLGAIFGYWGVYVAIEQLRGRL